MPVGQVAYQGSKYFPEPSVFDGPLTVNNGAVTLKGGLSVTGGTGVTGSKAYLYNYLEPSTSLASTVPRSLASAASAALTSGTVYVTAIVLEAGTVYSNVSLFVTTAEATGTHAWVGLANSAGTVQAVSADNTGAAYFGGANTAVTTALAAKYRPTTTGLYYVFACIAATTPPVFGAAPALVNAALSAVAPVACGTALTGQTTPVAVGSALGALTATAGHVFYAWLT